MLIIQFLILQVIVFSAVIYFLKKILYGDTESAINRLDGVYQDLLKKQKELTEKIETAEKEYQAKKEEGNQVINKMKSETLEELRTKRDEAVKKARSEAEEIINKAHASTKKMEQELEKKARDKMLDYIADYLGKMFQPKILSVIHDAMVDDFLSKGKTLDLSKVGSHIDTLMIRSAMALKPEMREKVSSMVAQRLGRTLKCEEFVDPGLISGIQLQFGTLILDGSFASAAKEAGWEAKKEELPASST